MRRTSKPLIFNPQTGRMVRAKGNMRIMLPHTQEERNSVYKLCGADCFIDPENRRHPLCTSLSRTLPGEFCKPQCKAIKMVKRSYLERYPEDEAVRNPSYKKATLLEQKYGCQTKKRTPRSPKRASPIRKSRFKTKEDIKREIKQKESELDKLYRQLEML